MGTLVDLPSSRSVLETVAQVAEQTPVVVVWASSTCSLCQRFEPIFAEAAMRTSPVDARFYRVDADDAEFDLDAEALEAGHWHADRVPTVRRFFRGRVEEASDARVDRWIEGDVVDLGRWARTGLSRVP